MILSIKNTISHYVGFIENKFDDNYLVHFAHHVKVIRVKWHKLEDASKGENSKTEFIH